MRRTAILLFAFAGPTIAADQPFQPLGDPVAMRALSPTAVRATAVHAFVFDSAAFDLAMEGTVAERHDEVRSPSTVLMLPHPDGALARFRVIESPVMAPELARKFPETRTFRGEGIDDPSASVRFDVGPRGFSAQVLSVNGAWYVAPWAPGVTDVVASFHRRDARRDPAATFRCEAKDAEGRSERLPLENSRADLGPVPAPLISVGQTLKTYRLALATTGEYSVAVCGPSPSIACVHNALVTAVNRVTGIYEREVAIRLSLIGLNDLLIWLNGATDPYTNSNGSAMLLENQTTIDFFIGSANYDIGHVFSTGGGGLASPGVVCWSARKAMGVTGSLNPTGDAFWVDFVAHEIGHQFDANHTFNASSGNCGGTTRNAATAFEPGSGSTIMAYAGICDDENLQLNSDPYFHGASFDEIVSYSSNTNPGYGGSCPTSSAGNNSPPSVEAGPSYTIPSRTYFALSGSASDPDADPLTYCWEEFDLGPASSAPPFLDNGSSPIFRSFTPSASATRFLPKYADMLAGSPGSLGESLPLTSRTMIFRLTARDNWTVGGVNSDTTAVTTVGTAGPFWVTSPTTGTTWPGGSTQTVTWSVNGTSAPPISCSNVSLFLSTDGGYTFPYTLAASTANDGSHNVTVPVVTTTTARVFLACIGNIFFDISYPNFTITAPAAPTVSAINPSSGSTAGGTAVTISGTGFVSGATVSIGGVSASSVAVVSTTTITAVTGARIAGTVDVVVANPGGASGSKASAYTYIAASSALRFYPITPCRIVDTRLADGPLGGPSLASSPAERTFAIIPGCGIPAEAKVASANVTVTQAGAPGALRFFPADISTPNVSTISFVSGKDRANNAMLFASAADGLGRVRVRNDATGPVHVVIDVNGYFR